MPALVTHGDRLFPADPATLPIARRLYAEVGDLPIVSPHGHTDPRWFAENPAFPDPAALLITPDHYLFRLLHSQGVAMEDLGLRPLDGGRYETDPRKIWRTFAAHWHLFRGTPSRLWLDCEMRDVLGVTRRLDAATADDIYDEIADKLARPEFRPRALYERFNIEVLSTTDSPLSDLAHHAAIRASGWRGRVVPAFRPDCVIDPEYFPDFPANLRRLGELTGEDVGTWAGYLRALESRRRVFITLGCTSTDHGHPTPGTADLDRAACEALFARIASGAWTPADAELFRRQMLTEMARMSIADGLVMQLHPGCHRSHNEAVWRRFGRDMGGDIPVPVDFVRGLKPLLDRFGNDHRLTLILFTLDESTYSRELAPLAGHYPCLRLGPAWWFHDSPEGMMRYRRLTTETAGFHNTVGFNDDTRALLSIPARHDVARRVDCAYLAELVAQRRLDEDEAVEVARDLAHDLALKAYKLDSFR